MSTHAAVVTTAIHGPLEILRVPTIAPKNGEVCVRVEWTASTPFDMHQNDGGLLVKHPQVLGDGLAGTVVEAGHGLKHLAVGDKVGGLYALQEVVAVDWWDQVFGFGWREQKEKAHQEFATVPEILLGKVRQNLNERDEGTDDRCLTRHIQLPQGFTLREAVTLPNNFVTVFHALATDLGAPTPWPKPAGYTPPSAESAILIWGGASSVGQYALQILRYYGYRNLLTTASKKHHSKLISLGASKAFDYNDSDVVEQIIEAGSAGRSSQPTISLILDCIGSQQGSIQPLSKIAQKGAKVAVLLPVIVKDSTDSTIPEYALDVEKVAEFADGVEVRGVRTHFYVEVSSHVAIRTHCVVNC